MREILVTADIETVGCNALSIGQSSSALSLQVRVSRLLVYAPEYGAGFHPQPLQGMSHMLRREWGILLHNDGIYQIADVFRESGKLKEFRTTLEPANNPEARRWSVRTK